MNKNQRIGPAFEDEVRRVVAAVWGLEPGDCQPAQYRTDLKLREIDAIVQVDEVLHLIMATARPDLQKCKDDCDRLNWAAAYFAKRSHDLIKKWFITKNQLQAPHHEYARRHNVTALTLEEFRRRFFDGFEYTRLRREASFGSARDPITQAPKIKDDAYVPLPMFWYRKDGSSFSPEPVDLDWLTDRIASGHRVVLTAPFGGGKSLTTRELFKRLIQRAQRGSNERWPLTLNLRDHYGQSAGDELLERHARMIGFAKRSQLVAAWRAGMAHLLLDGFDEIGAQAIFQADNRQFMRTARRQALTGVRSLTTTVPVGVGVLLCGRNQFFDDRSEMATALGFDAIDFDLVTLEEFTENSAATFLRKNGVQRELPDWVPRKPLILSYLLQRGLLEEILRIDGSRGFGYAWDVFIDRICQRETHLEGSLVEPEALRHVLERLALLVRARTSGNGPITGSDLFEAYRFETGQEPGGSVLTQLQRLPGLAQRDHDSSARSFVDDDMLAALQGGGFARLLLGAMNRIESPMQAGAGVAPLTELNSRACEMAAYLLHSQRAVPDLVVEEARRFAAQSYKDGVARQNCADAVAVAVALARTYGHESISFRGLTVDGAMVGRVSGEDLRIESLTFRDCHVHEVVLEGLQNVVFDGGAINKVSGAADEASLPAETFVGVDIDQFDNLSTNNAIQQLSLNPQIKALLVTLRKLYLQPGSGRKTSALYRGMPASISEYVPNVLRTLQSHHIVAIDDKVVYPIRRQTARVHRILGAPTLSSDAIVVELNDVR